MPTPKNNKLVPVRDMIARLTELSEANANGINFLKSWLVNVDVDVKTAAAITGYSENTIYKMVSEGDMPHIKRGRKILRFSPREILDWKEKKNTHKSIYGKPKR